MNIQIKQRFGSGMLMVCLLATMTACTTETNLGTQGALTHVGTAQIGNQEEDIVKPMCIRFMCNIGLRKEDRFDEFVTEYERLTGIKLDFEYNRPNDYYERLQLAFASNKSPDVCIVGEGKLPIYTTYGFLYDMTDLVSASSVISKMDPVVLKSGQISGRTYGIPLEDNSGTVTYIRKDLLDEVGQTIPTNYEEYIEMLRGFKRLGKDMIPMTAPGVVEKQAELYLREFYQDASPQFVLIEGEWRDGMLEKNMLDALYRMRIAYGEGLIDKEILTNQTSTCREKWNAGLVGAFTYWAGDWNINMEEGLKENVEKAEVLPIHAIQESHYIKRVPITVSMARNTPNPEGVFKYFIEYMNDGAQGSTLWQHGVEGIHWKQEENQIVHIPLREEEPDVFLKKAFISPATAIAQIKDTTKKFEIDQRVENSLKILMTDGIQATSVPASPTLAKLDAEILNLREKTIASILLGEVGVEEGIERYRQQIALLGLDQILKELNREIMVAE